MVAIFCMCMIMDPAKTEIKEMCSNDHDDRRNEQPGFHPGKELFQHQESEPGEKNDHWQETVMMPAVTVIERK